LIAMPAAPGSLEEGAIAATPGLTPGVSHRQGLIPLRAVFGQDEVNHDTKRYPVDEQHLVRVPLEAVGPLIATAGFARVEMPVTPISTGTVKVCHDDASVCSYRGRQYPGDENGDFAVPAEAAGELLAHGFVPALLTLPPELRRIEPSRSSRSERS
jgi:hypothetical protein